MRSDIITISSDLSGRDAAMKAAERFAAYHSLTGRDAMHIRLLTEETVCLVHGILDDFSGTFWLESDETNDGLHCRICLSADKHVNKAQEDMILSVSTSGKNESSKGILGKLREIVRSSIQEGSEAFRQPRQQVRSQAMPALNWRSYRRLQQMRSKR